MEEVDEELVQASSGGGPTSESGDSEIEPDEPVVPDSVGDNVKSCSPSDMRLSFEC
jgi:hypothetical protein